jgi:hypothetical protein
VAIQQAIYDTATKRYRPWDSSVDPPIEGYSYLYVQAAPSTSWVVNHSLGVKYLAVTVFDNYDREILVAPDWTTATTHSLTINFGQPMAGRVYLKPLV